MGSKNRTNYFSPFKKKIDSWRLSHSCHSEVMFIPNLFGDLRLGKALDLYITGSSKYDQMKQDNACRASNRPPTVL